MEHFCSVTSLFDGSAGDIDVPCDAFGCPAACTNDAAGNTTAYGTRSYTYDDAGRMSQYLASGVVTRTFAFNGRGERVGKRVPGTPGSDTWFVYDEAGHLIGEYRGNGTRVREYVWLDDVPVAVFVSHAGTTYQYVLTDHLNTPRAVVLPTTNAIVWRWDLTGSAFGEHAVQANPDGDASSYTLLLRYPGQYHDTDTALYYNYFRDYDPTTGRYVESDQVGLIGDANTYLYAVASPLNAFDPLGLWSLEVGGFFPLVGPFGPGGSVTFVVEDGDFQSISYKVAVGVGGGVSFSPEGRSPDPEVPVCATNGMALFGELSYAIGPIGAGGDARYGATWHDRGIHGYEDASPKSGMGLSGLRFKQGVQGQAAAGLEFTHYFEQEGEVCECH